MSTTVPSPESHLLSAAAAHDVPQLKELLKKTSAQTQDPDTLDTPLHAAVASLSAQSPAKGEDVAAAEEAVRELLQAGAIWNDLNAAGNTPACIARRAGPAGAGCYELLVQAGVRAEVLLSRLQGWGVLDSDGDDDGDDEPNEKERGADDGIAAPEDADVTSAAFLASQLRYGADTSLLDADANGVMMAWERGIMERSVAELLPDTPADSPDARTAKRVLNVGFGLGIVDGEFQARIGGARGGTHVIVEAHPDVLRKMDADGWPARSGVTVLRGRWQDVLPPLLAAGQCAAFDAIYFDTFAEDYAALRTFFCEFVVALLAEHGRFGFFHGLGADRQVSYDVYTRVVELDLFDAGLDTRWVDVPIDPARPQDGGQGEQGEGEGAGAGEDRERWKGVRRRYWDVGDIYRMPVCTFIGS